MKTIGIIGLGSIGMRHAKNLADMGHRVNAYDPDEKRAFEFMDSWPTGAPNPRGSSTHLDEIIQTSDAVVIASPTPEHAKHLSVAIDYGLDIFVEKPIMDGLRLNAHEIERLDSVCHAMVGYNLRFHSCVKKAKEWLNAGLIGSPVWANFTLGQYNDRPDYLRDGVILNWSHELDLALYLLGAASLSASSTHRTNSGQDDLTDILLTHENACRSIVHLDYVTKPEHRYFKIIGELGDIYVDLVERFSYLKTETLEQQYYGKDTWNDNYIEEMQAFIDRIDGKETIGCSGEEGLEVLKVCLEVRKQAGLE